MVSSFLRFFNPGMALVALGLTHEAVTPLLAHVAQPTKAMIEAGWINFGHFEPQHIALYWHALGLQMVVAGLMMHFYIRDCGRPLPLLVGVVLFVSGLALGLCVRVGLSGFMVGSLIGAYIIISHLFLNKSNTTTTTTTKKGKSK